MNPNVSDTPLFGGDDGSEYESETMATLQQQRDAAYDILRDVLGTGRVFEDYPDFRTSLEFTHWLLVDIRSQIEAVLPKPPEDAPTPDNLSDLPF